MRQAVLSAPQTIAWRDVPAPLLGPGEILVRIRAALTCGTDLKTYRRGHPKLSFGPFGHEASGDVVEIGDGVKGVFPGDAVMWVQTAPCGECPPCRRGHENLCERLFEEVALGAYGDYLVLPRKVVERNLYRKPAHLSYIEAAFLEPLACVIHGWNVIKRADALAPLPEAVAIIGAGTMGLLHLLYAKRAGVRTCLVGRGAERLALASKLGAGETIDAQDPSADESLRARSFQAVIEAAGTEAAWRQALGLAAPGGRVLLFGGLPQDSEVGLDATRLHYSEIVLLGVFHFTPGDVKEARDLLVTGSLPLRQLISAVEPLENLADVFVRLDRRQGYKYALVPGAASSKWI